MCGIEDDVNFLGRASHTKDENELMKEIKTPEEKE
jgi:hypothetical protein